MTTEQPTPDLPPEAIEAGAKAFAFDVNERAWGALAEETRDAYRQRSADVLTAALPFLRAQIEAEQRKVLDRELDRYDPADSYGEAVEHGLVADIGRKLIDVARGGTDA